MSKIFSFLAMIATLTITVICKAKEEEIDRIMNKIANEKLFFDK